LPCLAGQQVTTDVDWRMRMAGAGFPEVVKRYMAEGGMGTRALARALHHDPGYLSKVLRGMKACGPDLAHRIDEALAAGCTARRCCAGTWETVLVS
jgi:hypothetical protein